MRFIRPDKNNAWSIILASKKQMKYTLTIVPTEDSAFSIIRNIYECFRMLGDAILISEGKKSEDHIEQLKALENVKVQTSRPVKLIDNMRKMRHGINYYGYIPSKAEAEDAVSFANSCYFQLVREIEKIIG